ncbi:glutamate--cysteine ligase [Arthrobacter pityocampae]|uniref:glutamate--cysteine ligase n=1 Tax=Arthrobacter pityocampae TaxID=547334 RepID=UPI001F4DE1E0|nr:glutamate--cysteine ligase [Arthrobacter pityocampae]
MNAEDVRTFGIEEELLLVDGATGLPLAASWALLEEYTHADQSGPTLEAELQQEMIEVVSSAPRTLARLVSDVVAGRAVADRTARAVGARAAALATSPLPGRPHVHPTARFGAIIDRYGVLARENLTCGMHVHVFVTSPREGVGVLDRIRTWLPVLVALSANSPFVNGQDTGFASYRSQVWQGWPSAGPSPVYGSVGAYRAREDELMATGVLLDRKMLYFDARLSRTYPTVEIRVADVCLFAEDAGVIAALARGLVETAARDWRAGLPPAKMSAPALRLAGLQARLSGLGGDLVHPLTGRPAPAWDVVVALLNHVLPALTEAGDTAAVVDGLLRLLDRGTGADRQRGVLQRTGRLADVVTDAVEVTHSSARSGTAAGPVDRRVD